MQSESDSKEFEDRAWVQPIHERIVRIVDAEFEGCYPERDTLAAREEELYRIWEIVQSAATKQSKTHSGFLKIRQKQRATLPDVINKVLDQIECGRVDPRAISSRAKN